MSAFAPLSGAKRTLSGAALSRLGGDIFRHRAMLAARAYTNPQAGGTSGIFLAGLSDRLGIAGASTASPFLDARVTTVTESSKNHQSVNPPALQPRPIIGGERHGA
jgi:hypothetical protein